MKKVHNRLRWGNFIYFPPPILAHFITLVLWLGLWTVDIVWEQILRSKVFWSSFWFSAAGRIGDRSTLISTSFRYSYSRSVLRFIDPCWSFPWFLPPHNFLKYRWWPISFLLLIRGSRRFRVCCWGFGGKLLHINLRITDMAHTFGCFLQNRAS